MFGHPWHRVEFIQEPAHETSVPREIGWQDLGVGQPQRHTAPHVRHGGHVTEAGVTGVAHPVRVVVLGMVYAVRAVERHVHDRQSQEVEEDGVIGATAEPVLDQVEGIRVGGPFWPQ